VKQPGLVLAAVALALTVAGCAGSEPAARLPSPTANPPARVFTTPGEAGVPLGWTPKRTLGSELVVKEPGAVVEDVRLQNADLVVAAPNVTLRRVELQGGRIRNQPGEGCENGLVVEDTTVGPPPGAKTGGGTEGGIGVGGYTARRVKLWRLGEGFRVSGRSSGCGPVLIEDSFASIVIPKSDCTDSHADGLQSYDGPALTVLRTTLDFREAACGTAPFFVPSDQNNADVTVDGLLVLGGGYPFRLGVPGTVKDLRIADGTWGYGPLDVDCALVAKWDARIVRVDRSFKATEVRRQPCG
jgi:hypothetical protein